MFSFPKHLCPFAFFTIILIVTACSSVETDQTFDGQGLFDAGSKVMQGDCRPEIQASMATPGTRSALATFMNFSGPDGHTPMCLYGIMMQPTQLKFSPDGRYLYTFTLINHNWAYDVYQLETGKLICDGRGDGHHYRSGNNCPPIKLADGRWWSGIFPNIVLKSNSSTLWNLVNSSSSFVDPALSPDGEWIIGKSGNWFIASADAQVIHHFSVLSSYVTGQAPAAICGQNPGLIAWRADSKQFAVISETDKVVSIWSIGDNKSIHMDDSITLEKCTATLKLSSDGKINIK